MANEWDLTYTRYSGLEFDPDEESYLWGMVFNDDGDKFYIVGSENKVFQYTIGTPWLISTASYASKYVDISPEDSLPRGIAFSSDGTKMFMVGSTNNSVFQYTLSTAWDVSSANYASKSCDLSSETEDPWGVAFNDDGTTMFITESKQATQGKVFQYTLSSAWDVSTASYAEITKELSSYFAKGIYFSDDGGEMFTLETLNDKVYQYTLSTEWDVTVISNVEDYTETEDASPTSFTMSANGKYFYIGGTITDKIYQYSSSQPVLNKKYPLPPFSS